MKTQSSIEKKVTEFERLVTFLFAFEKIGSLINDGRMKTLENWLTQALTEVVEEEREGTKKYINNFLKKVRNNNSPFGGVQMLFLGDFSQLPPVNGEFCFKSSVWQEMIKK